MIFVVLPNLKIDLAMLDSTYFSRKPREEQQQMQGELLFYQRTKTTRKNVFPTHRQSAPKHNADYYQQFREKQHAKALVKLSAFCRERLIS